MKPAAQGEGHKKFLLIFFLIFQVPVVVATVPFSFTRSPTDICTGEFSFSLGHDDWGGRTWPIGRGGRDGRTGKKEKQ